MGPKFSLDHKTKQILGPKIFFDVTKNMTEGKKNGEKRQILPEQMMPWQMSREHLCHEKDGPRNLPLNLDLNWVSNSWEISDIEFVRWVGSGAVGGRGGVAKSFSCQTQLRLSWSWVEVEFGFLQL